MAAPAVTAPAAAPSSAVGTTAFTVRQRKCFGCARAMAGGGAAAYMMALRHNLRLLPAPVQNSSPFSRSSQNGCGNGSVASTGATGHGAGVELLLHSGSSKFRCGSAEIVMLRERRRQRSFSCVVRAAAPESTPAAKPAAEPAPKPEAKAESKPKTEAQVESSPKSESEESPPPKPAPPKKPKPTMKKGQVVRVDKEKYLDSVEYYAVAHPKFYKGIDYIYEDRGEVLDIRFYEAGEYALVSWAGIPTSPAWLPTYMLIESEKLSYKRE